MIGIAPPVVHSRGKSLHQIDCTAQAAEQPLRCQDDVGRLTIACIHAVSDKGLWIAGTTATTVQRIYNSAWAGSLPGEARLLCCLFFLPSLFFQEQSSHEYNGKMN